MSIYRKKPIEVEVRRFPYEATPRQLHDICTWMEENLYPFLVGNALDPETLRYHDQVEGDDSKPDKGIYIDPGTGLLMIRTLEGDMRVNLGDWIIKGVSGEFYSCDPDIFALTYEFVKES